MGLKTIRRQRGWSQEQLADISGVSVRTIQRLEKGEEPGLETLKALAATFEQPAEIFRTNLGLSDDAEAAAGATGANGQLLTYGWKGFLIHLAAFMLAISWLVAISYFSAIEADFIVWVALVWGAGLALHAERLISISKP